MASEETRKYAPISMRAGKTRFRRHMRVVREISDDLYALLESLPTPDKQEMEEALSPIGPLSPDMHFLGALNAIHFLISEAILLAEEEERFAKSRAAHFLVDSRVARGLQNVAGLKATIRLPIRVRRKMEGDPRA
jgi:hypothetical protein